LGYLGWSARVVTPNAQPLSSKPILMKILYCVDGDTCTAQTENKLKVKLRLIGIDAPELGHHLYSDQAFAREARDYLNNLVKNQNVLVKNQGFDIYGRQLALIYLKLKNEIFVNEKLIEEGLALAYKNPKDQSKLDWAEKTEWIAQRKKKGLWSLPPSLQPDPKKFRNLKRSKIKIGVF
jgi:micrococcal nuclease